MKYKIELRYFYGWDDAGWIDETEEEIAPTRFDTIAEAKAGLNEFFVGVEAAVADGAMEFGHDRAQYRIVEANDE